MTIKTTLEQCWECSDVYHRADLFSVLHRKEQQYYCKECIEKPEISRKLK